MCEKSFIFLLYLFVCPENEDAENPTGNLKKPACNASGVVEGYDYLLS